MKILFLVNIPSPYRVDFFNELGKLCDLTVLYECKTADDRDKKWLNHKAESFCEIYLKGVKVGNDTALCFNVYKWMKDRSFDLIVVGGYSTPTGMCVIEYLRKKKIPFVLNVDGGMIRKERKINYIIKHYLIGQAAAWLSTSGVTDEYLLHYGAKPENIFRYPFTSLKEVDILEQIPSLQRKIEIRKKLEVKEEKVIVSVGQFIYRKGFDLLIESSQHFDSNIGVYIIGGEPTAEFIAMKHEMGLNNLHFVGFKEKEELKEYYMAADLFVLPTREDIWGLVINEAMAYGLPVITSDKCVAGLELVRNNENGFIIHGDDIVLLSEAVNSIIKNKQILQYMSTNSLVRIREFTIENMAQCHMDIFKLIIEKSISN